MRVDAHQHFWRYDPAEHAWITPDLAVLRQDYLPGDLKPLLDACGMDGCVAVQARQTLEETRWLLELADKNPWIVGVVGWVDLCAENVEEQLRPFLSNPSFKGVRHDVQSEPDDRFLLRADFQRGIRALTRHDLAYDLLLLPRHLPAAAELAAAHPGQRFILDHLAKPEIRSGRFLPWAEDLRRLASCPNVACKLSGLVTEADRHNWKPSDFTPYIELAMEVFGPSRMMVGSDWPVCLLSVGYAQVCGLAEQFLAGLPPAEREAVWSGAAQLFYRF